MQNIGEEICGEYLKYVLKCDFVSYNVSPPDVQGEIDVVGISLEKKTIYICEVATHTGGLQYVTEGRPDDFNRFHGKFKKGIDYALKYFPNYNVVVPMLWSPIVRVGTEKAKYDTYAELIRLQKQIKKDYQLDLQMFVNEKFLFALDQLRSIAYQTSTAFNGSVMRLFQIETKLQRHVENAQKRSSKKAS
jgi:hypothetical protein